MWLYHHIAHGNKKWFDVEKSGSLLVEEMCAMPEEVSYVRNK